MKRINMLLGALALGFGLSSASAGDHYAAPVSDSGTFYAFGFGGATFMDEMSGYVSGIAGNPALILDTDDGYTVGGGLGVRSQLLGGSRLEIEGFYTENDVNGGSLGGNAFPAASGTFETAGFHFNVIKEFDMGAIRPYAGVGLGYASVSAENVAYGPINFSDSDGAFSWQVIVGLEADLTEAAALFIEYNYNQVGDISLQRSATTVANFEDIDFHNLQAGIRISF